MAKWGAMIKWESRERGRLFLLTSHFKYPASSEHFNICYFLVYVNDI